MPELSFDWDESKRFKNIEKHGVVLGRITPICLEK
jgi:uncharacterized DUF497 family protein